MDTPYIHKNPVKSWPYITDLVVSSFMELLSYLLELISKLHKTAHNKLRGLISIHLHVQI